MPDMTLTDTSAPARPAPRFPEFVALMAGMMALTALSIDIMLPALDLIRADLAVAGENDQQLVVTAYVLGFALGQVFQGPLSDSFGRRPVLFCGLAIYAAASFACMFAGGLDTLLAARFLQGLGNAAPRVVAVAVIRDIYGGRRMAEVMSFVMMVFIIVPVIAPGIGSLFLLAGDWHFIFGFLGIVAIAILTWSALRLPETRPPEAREPLSLRWIAAAFRKTLGTPQTLGYTLATGCVFGTLLSYVGSAQQIFTEVYGFGAWFPVIFGAVTVGMALASLINSRLVMRVGMRRLSHGALIGFAAAGIVLALLSQGTEPPPLGVLIGVLSTSLFCFGLIMPNFNALAMEPMGAIAGTASSFVGAVTTGMAASIGWYVGQHYDGTVAPLATGFAVLPVVGLAIVLATERGRLFRVGSPT
jgi:DHA1 family bicyclomycin/chloramphenicol resistance-like MFS transporter